MDLPTRIRTSRMGKGLSQRDLARHIKVAPSAVAQWESGATAPSLKHRVELTRLLEIPFIEMLPEADNVTEISIRDPQTVIFVRQYLSLPPQVREALLMQVVATAEMIATQAPTEPARQPIPATTVKPR